MGDPQQDLPRVDPAEEPSPLPMRIPVPADGGAFPFGHRLTLQAIGRANLAQGAVEEYAHALLGAPYTAQVWPAPVPETIGACIESAFEDARYRARATMFTTALLVPSWVVDHLAQTEQPPRVPVIEIPMNPTAPVWHAVAIVANDQRAPSLVRPAWRPVARYPCPALPEHLEAFAAHQAAAEAAREHERKYAALGQSYLEAKTVRQIIAAGDLPVISDDPAVQQHQIKQQLYRSARPEDGGRDDR